MAPQNTLRRWEYRNWTLSLAASAAAVLVGCTADPPAPGTRRGDEGRSAAGTQAAVTGGWESMKLPWGSGKGQVGLRPAGPELPAEGPSAAAVSSNGEVLVLDRLNERVIAIDAGGAVAVRGSVSRDAEHLAAGPGGVFAAWSPLRGRVWLTGRDGSALGEVAVPRELRDVERISVGLSHRVAAVSALQETVQLGSPRAPLDLGATLRTRREGAAFLADGRGVASLRTESGAGEIFVYRQVKPGDDSKPEVGWTFPIAGKVAAVRVIGAAGKAICARVERVAQAEAIAVEREALCVEADTGKVLVQRALGRPGLYTVKEELAVGGEPGVLVFVRPEEDGLRVERMALDSPPGSGGLEPKTGALTEPKTGVVTAAKEVAR